MIKRRTILLLSTLGLAGGAGWLHARNKDTSEKTMTESSTDVLAGLDANPESIEQLELNRGTMVQYPQPRSILRASR